MIYTNTNPTFDFEKLLLGFTKEVQCQFCDWKSIFAAALKWGYLLKDLGVALSLLFHLFTLLVEFFIYFLLMLTDWI